MDRLLQIEGAMPRLSAIPQGCAYNPRCPRVFDRCKVARPELLEAGATRAACWLYDTADKDAARAAAEAAYGEAHRG
jgi:peptide/nickel transport system ATP-binding protein